MVAAALARTVGFKVPVLTLSGILVLNYLFAGSHDSVLTEVVVGSDSVLPCNRLLACQHLALGVESILFGINAEQLDAALSVMGFAVLEIEAVGFIFLA